MLILIEQIKKGMKSGLKHEYSQKLIFAIHFD